MRILGKEDINEALKGKEVESIDFTEGELEIVFTCGSRIDVQLDGQWGERYLTVSATPR